MIVVLSGPVALLGDTLHNAADALTAVPLGIAFVLGRRAANLRYTYGYGRAEDLAGILIVATIGASAALTAWVAADLLLDPHDVTHLWAVSAAALTGFAGSAWVARYRIRTGRKIGSAALAADGLHARADGFTSLAVLLGAGGAALGRPMATCPRARPHSFGSAAVRSPSAVDSAQGGGNAESAGPEPPVVMR